MSNIKAQLGKAVGFCIYYAIIYPFEWGKFIIRKHRLNKAVEKAIRLHMADRKHRYVVPVGRGGWKYEVLTRQELREIVKEYQRRHGGKFVSWRRFCIATTE